MQKYIVCSSSKRDLDQINAHYKACTRTNRPYIYVSKHTKYGDVHFDYFSFDEEKEQKLINNAASISDDISRAYDRYRGEQSSATFNELVVNIKNIPAENAEPLALEIYGIIAKWTD